MGRRCAGEGTALFPAALVPGTMWGRRADIGIHAPTQRRVKPARAPCAARPCRPWKAQRLHRPSCRHEIRPLYVRGSPDTPSPAGTRRHAPAQGRNSPLAKKIQLAGRFRSVWQVMGSNHRRLSRRFYSTLAAPEALPADRHRWSSASKITSTGRPRAVSRSGTLRCPQRNKVPHRRTEKNGPHSRVSAASGPGGGFRRARLVSTPRGCGARHR